MIRITTGIIFTCGRKKANNRRHGSKIAGTTICTAIYRAKFVLPHYQYDPSDLELHFLPDNKLLVCVNSYVQTPSYRKWVAGGCDTEPLVPNTESVEIQNSSLRRIESPARRSK